MSKLKDDLKYDPKLASQYGVVLKRKSDSCLVLTLMTACAYVSESDWISLKFYLAYNNVIKPVHAVQVGSYTGNKT